MARNARPTSCVKAKAFVPVGFDVVIEDAADAAHLLAVLEIEILVAPRLVFVVGRDLGMGVTGALHRGVKRDRVGIVLGAAGIEHRREVSAAAEPGLGGHHEARVHVHGRHVRVVQVGDQRDARRPEPRIGVGAGNVLAGIRGRTRRARSSNARRPSRTPGRASSTSRRRRRGRRRGSVRCQGVRSKRPAGRSDSVLPAGRASSTRLEGRADVIAQALEPAAGARLAVFERGRVEAGRATWACPWGDLIHA